MTFMQDTEIFDMSQKLEFMFIFVLLIIADFFLQIKQVKLVSLVTDIGERKCLKCCICMLESCQIS